MNQFKRFLPEKPLMQNDDFIIYGNNDLDFIKDDLLLSLSQEKLFLLNFFGLKSFDRIRINLFNDHNIFMALLDNSMNQNLILQGILQME